MTSIISPLCMWCKHKKVGFTCDAFPGRIPEKIVHSTVLHIDPYKGDKGIRFEPILGKEAEAEEWKRMLQSNIDKAGGKR